MITLDNMSQHTRVKEDELLTWSVYRFYSKYMMLSHKAKIDENYQEIRNLRNR